MASGRAASQPAFRSRVRPAFRARADRGATEAECHERAEKMRYWILPVLRISLIMTSDPMRDQRYYYCAALVEHIEPCTVFRTNEIGMANCWSSGPILIGGQVKDIVQRIDWCVREYTKAVMQANPQAQPQPVRP